MPTRCGAATYTSTHTCTYAYTYPQVCRFYDANPLWGCVGFDNMVEAWVTVVRSVTVEGWSEVLYLLQLVAPPRVATTFMVTLVVFGGCYLLNLFLAVIWHVYRAPKTNEPPSRSRRRMSRRPSNEHAAHSPDVHSPDAHSPAAHSPAAHSPVSFAAAAEEAVRQEAAVEEEAKREAEEARLAPGVGPLQVVPVLTY